MGKLKLMKPFLIFILKLLTIPISFILTAIINTSIGKSYKNDFPFNLSVILYIIFGIFVLTIIFLYLNDIRRHNKLYIKFGIPILSLTTPLLIFLILTIDKSFASNKTYNKTEVLEVIEFLDTKTCSCRTDLGFINLDLRDCFNMDSISLMFSESLFKNKLLEKQYKIEEQRNCNKYQKLNASQKMRKRCFEDALIELNTCIESNPIDFDCLYERGVILMHKEDYQNAQHDFIMSLIIQNVDYGEDLETFITSDIYKNYKTELKELVHEKNADEIVSFVNNFERLGNFKSTMFRIEYCEEKLKRK